MPVLSVSRPLRSLCLIVVLLAGSLVLSLPNAAPSVAQSSGGTTALDEALARVDSVRTDGRFQEALSQLSRLRDERGDEVGILWRMSLIQVDLAKTLDGKDARKPHYQKALTLANAALAADTTNAHAHLAKAVAEGRIALDAGTQERVRRSRAVKKHADRAIELDSTLDGAYHTRARWNRGVADLGFFSRAIVKTVYGGLPEASFEQAVRDFKRAIELHNERFHHLELAKTYLKMDREEDARRELKTVLGLPAKDPFDDRYKKEAQKLLAELK
jgi:tetratricopeptide (TPR) repeat protein